MKLIENILKEAAVLPNLERIFDELNKMFFDNSLPPIPLKYASLTGSTGIFEFRYKREGYKYVDTEIVGIKINKKYILDEQTIKNVLCHEMIHYWCYQQGLFKEGHGFRFRDKMNEINSKNKGVVVSLTDEIPNHTREVNKELNKEVLVIIREENGNYSYGRTDLKREDEIKLKIENSKGAKGTFYFIHTSNKEAIRIPGCKKGLSMYAKRDKNLMKQFCEKFINNQLPDTRKMYSIEK